MMEEKPNGSTNLLRDHQLTMLQLLQALDGVCQKHEIQYQLFAGTALGAVRHRGFIPWDDDLDVILLRPQYERFLEAAEKELDPEVFYLQREFSEHWPMHYSKLRLQNTTCLEQYEPKDPLMHQGIYIDIFPCDNLSDSPIKARLQFMASKIVIAKSLDRRGYLTHSLGKKAFMLFCRVLPQKPFLIYCKNAGESRTKRVHSFFGASSRYNHAVYEREWMEQSVPMLFETGQYPVSTQYDSFLRVLYGDYMTPPPPEKVSWKRHAFLVDTDQPYTKYLNAREGITFKVLTRSIR